MQFKTGGRRVTSNERLAFESSFRFRLIGPEVFDVVFLSKLVLAVVLGASALSVFFLGPGGEILFLADLSDNVLSLEKVEFIFQGSDVTKKKREKRKDCWKVLIVSRARFFYLFALNLRWGSAGMW